MQNYLISARPHVTTYKTQYGGIADRAVSGEIMDTGVERI